MSYIKDDFLLRNETAKKLYNDYAKDMPIFVFQIQEIYCIPRFMRHEGGNGRSIIRGMDRCQYL